jgi:hypothetical protein
MRQQTSDLEARMAGWMQSLGKPDLPARLRENLESQYTMASAQLEKLAAESRALDAVAPDLPSPDAPALVRVLQELDRVLGAGNATAGNFELSLHIDGIDAYADGHIVMRGSDLGIFDGCTPTLAGAQAADETSSAPCIRRVRSRQRGRLAVEPEASVGRKAPAPGADCDSSRVPQPPEAWTWNAPPPIWGGSFWSVRNAREVLAKRQTDPRHWTKAALAREFGVSVPTIRKALRIAMQQAAVAERDAPAPDEATADAA